MKEYNEGRVAYYNGAKFSDNPYRFFTIKSVDWQRGWNSAAMERTPC